MSATLESNDHRSAVPQHRHEWPPSCCPGQTELRCYDIAASRQDSDLQVFSHNPADSSFGLLAPQLSTKCLSLVAIKDKSLDLGILNTCTGFCSKHLAEMDWETAKSVV